MIRPIHPDDILVWPDGSHCDRRDLPEMNHMGDDYIVLPADSPEWLQFLEEQDA